MGEYLAFISVKYEVDPDQFFNAIISAGENRKVKCGDLSIEGRGKTNNKHIFLIMKNGKVVAQFPISKEFLLERENPLRNFVETERIRRCLSKKNERPDSQSIGDLRTGLRHVNLKAKIVEVSEPKLVFTKYGNYANVAKALIEDETGSIKLCLWNDQINSVSIGDTVKIENARTYMFRGEKQLSLGKNGVLNNLEDQRKHQLAEELSV
ncbi:hypothetical protein KAI12_04230 [Candidatus Bathyarchaeota archaeon]|nr:hypothetical protein [Candidatus Bathyarchaeota archaeon]